MIFYLPNHKWRGKTIDGQRRWIEGTYIEKTINQVNGCYIIPDDSYDGISISEEILLQKMIRIDRTTLGYSSGVCDMNGKRIFTGDILEADPAYNPIYLYPRKLLVMYNDEYDYCFAEGNIQIEDDEFCNCRIIGNMFDDNELLDEFEKEIQVSVCVDMDMDDDI